MYSGGAEPLGSPSLMIKKRAGTCVPSRPGPGRKSGSTGTAITGSAALSATGRQRNHVRKIIAKPYVGNPRHMRETRAYGLKGG